MSASSPILLVDDDENDLLLAQRAFLKAKVINPVRAVRSGEEAIAYLSGEGRYADRTENPLPGLMLLDLNMPGVDGSAVLKWVREQPNLKGLRVVVLTASDSMRDVTAAYQAGANSFLIKPVDFERFLEISQALGGSWLWMRGVSGEPGGDTERFIRKVLEPGNSQSPLRTTIGSN